MRRKRKRAPTIARFGLVVEADGVLVRHNTGDERAHGTAA